MRGLSRCDQGVLALYHLRMVEADAELLGEVRLSLNFDSLPLVRFKRALVHSCPSTLLFILLYHNK
jgi:hypothetical protein